MVTRLESVLGVSLLSRTTRKLIPTAEGALFWRVAGASSPSSKTPKGSGALAREAARQAARTRGRGVRRESAGPGDAALRRGYLEVQVELIVEDRDLDVARNGIDISVRSGPPLDQSLVARKLGEFERVVCASPAYLERHGIPRSPGELATHACITTSSLPGRARWGVPGRIGLADHRGEPASQRHQRRLRSTVRPHGAGHSADERL